MTEKQNAFVIMPFGESFDEIYSIFITKTCEEAGFSVKRADDIRNSQNILKDILRGIVDSDIIVADLTDSNPNVYYELGIAHSFCKPIILLTQEINDLPFDLRSYRVVSYTSHFVDIMRAKDQVLELLRGYLSNESSFGGPITDFLPEYAQLLHPSKEKEVISEGELGLLDYLVNMEEGFEILTEIQNSYTQDTLQLTDKTNALTENIQSLSAHPDSTSARKIKSNVMLYAEALASYSRSLSERNDKYTQVLSNTRTAMEAAIRIQEFKNDSEITQLKNFLLGLHKIEEGASAELDGVNSMTETLRQLPAIERTFNRSREQAIRELQRFVDNIEQTRSMAIRAREIGESKIKQLEQKMLPTQPPRPME